MSREYVDFDLHVVRQGEGYAARVVASPSGTASAPFTLPFSASELAQFMVAVGPPRVSSRRLVPALARVATVKEYGRKLGDALLSGEVAGAFRDSLTAAMAQDRDVRVRLRLDAVPELDAVPWEYLYDSGLDRFLALSQDTPIVRLVDSSERPPVVQVRPPLRVLVMVSSPRDMPELAVDREKQLLRATLGDLVGRGDVELVVLEEATLTRLQRALLDDYHVFHFIGHGGFDEGAQEGVLVLEREDRTAHRVSGARLGTLLHDAHDLQLVVLNACEGARTSGRDAFSGVGQALVGQGVPAVVAMQTEISDRAALVFSHEFYYFLTRGLGIEAAICEVRKAMAVSDEAAEWGTAVLLRSDSEQPFVLNPSGSTARDKSDAVAARLLSLYSAAQAAISAGDTGTALPLLEQIAVERPDYADVAVLTERVRSRLTGSTGGEGESAGTSPPPPVSGYRRRLLSTVAGLSAAGAIGVGLLNVLGVAAGLVVNVVAVVVLVGAFVGSMAEILRKQFPDASARTKGLFVTGIVAVTALLVMAGLATRAVIPLHRLTGTADIAVVGFHPPNRDGPQAWEGLGESVASALSRPGAGEVHDYSNDVDPPLERLASSTDDGELTAWADDFVAQTGAELVIGGWADDAPGAHRLYVVAYVPAGIVSDAVELSGWFRVAAIPLDSSLSSTTARKEVTDQLNEQVGALSTFTAALDLWHAGHPEEAAARFDKVKLASRQSKILRALADLLRGHALESQAFIESDAAAKGALLTQARSEYQAVEPSAGLGRRVALSLTTNEYLVLALTACTPRAGQEHELSAVSDRLGAIAEASRGDLVSLKADANRGQVQLCRALAGAADAYQVAEPLLRSLTTLRPRGGVSQAAVVQIRSLAYSTEASLRGQRGEYAAAVIAIDQALELEERFERQALWWGLKARWLLLDCKGTEGVAAQQTSLDQLENAISTGRVPAADRTAYQKAFADDLAQAQSRCPSH